MVTTVLFLGLHDTSLSFILPFISCNFQSPVKLTHMFTQIPTLAFNAAIIAIDIHYYGRYHSYDVPLPTDTRNLKSFFISQLVFGFSEAPIKLSLLCFYQRLLGSAASFRFKLAISAAFIYVVGLFICHVFETIFSCVPIKASFDVFPTYRYTCVSDWTRVCLGILNIVAE